MLRRSLLLGALAALLAPFHALQAALGPPAFWQVVYVQAGELTYWTDRPGAAEVSSVLLLAPDKDIEATKYRLLCESRRRRPADFHRTTWYHVTNPAQGLHGLVGIVGAQIRLSPPSTP